MLSTSLMRCLLYVFFAVIITTSNYKNISAQDLVLGLINIFDKLKAINQLFDFTLWGSQEGSLAIVEGSLVDGSLEGLLEGLVEGSLVEGLL